MAVVLSGTTNDITINGSSVATDSEVSSAVAPLATTAYVDGKMVSMTAQNSTSGTSIDFTGIPSWAKRITLSLNAVSTNGASLVQFQLGAGPIQTTGYTSVGGITSGIGIQGSTSAADSRNGNTVFTLLNGNTWQCSGGYVVNGTTYGATAGGVTLTATLDRIRITTVNGTDTFDAGQINVMYEG